MAAPSIADHLQVAIGPTKAHEKSGGSAVHRIEARMKVIFSSSKENY